MEIFEGVCEWEGGVCGAVFGAVGWAGVIWDGERVGWDASLAEGYFGSEFGEHCSSLFLFLQEIWTIGGNGMKEKKR